MKSVCVFCGSRFGKNPRFLEDAEKLGQLLGRSGVELVYGGGHVGLMGAIADAVLQAGGAVTGVIPQGLFDREVAHTGLSRLEITADMHTRKALMAQRAEAFIAMPGGFGTLDELCEIITWAQLGLHSKPIILLDTDGFWSGFLNFVKTCVDQGFIVETGLFVVVRTPEEALALLKSY